MRILILFIDIIHTFSFNEIIHLAYLLFLCH